MGIRSGYDDLHDQYVAIGTTKAGTRYERLVALVAKVLDSEAGVTHDIKLIGQDTGVKHQIDVTIERKGGTKKRVLLECKDFDVSGDPVGLGIVRDFFGVVDDVKPDEAFVVTCNRFTSDAIKYAKGKGIKLAVLRRYTPEDDAGRIKRVSLHMELRTPIDVDGTIQFVDQAGIDAFNAATASGEVVVNDAGGREVDLRSRIRVIRPGREAEQIVQAFQAALNDPSCPEEAQPDGTFKKVAVLPDATVQTAAGEPIPIRSLAVTYRYSSHREEFTIESKKVAQLILRDLDKDDDFVICDEDLQRFSIDEATGQVLERGRPVTGDPK